MIDFDPEHKWVRLRAINRYPPPPPPPTPCESTFQPLHSIPLGHAAACAGRAACAAVCGLCLCWLHGPRIASFGLECEPTHASTHREEWERSQLTLILHILSSLNSAPQPELSSFSEVPPVTAYVCIYYVSVCTCGSGGSTPPKGQWGGKQKPCHKTHETESLLKEEIKEDFLSAEGGSDLVFPLFLE